MGACPHHPHARQVRECELAPEVRRAFEVAADAVASDLGWLLAGCVELGDLAIVSVFRESGDAVTFVESRAVVRELAARLWPEFVGELDARPAEPDRLWCVVVDYDGDRQFIADVGVSFRRAAVA